MLYQLLACGLVSLLNFGLHAIVTGIVIVATRHTAAATDDLHVFARVTALLMVTMVALMIAHLAEISVWAAYYAWHGIETAKASALRVCFRELHGAGLWRHRSGGAPAHRRPDHRPQRPAADRLVGRHHLRGDEDGRRPGRPERALQLTAGPLPLPACGGAVLDRGAVRVRGTLRERVSCETAPSPRPSPRASAVRASTTAMRGEGAHRLSCAIRACSAVDGNGRSGTNTGEIHV